MADPSYYPLKPLPPGHATSLSTEQIFKDDSDPPHLSGVTGATSPEELHSSMFSVPLRPQLFRKARPAGRLPLWRKIRTPLRMLLFPLAAIGYLSFCYTVHGTVVPVNTYGLYAVTTQHLATIKGGITTISIVIISIALYPVHAIVSNLKSEEFFRVLASHNHGVPLETINHISTPSFGNIDMMLAMWGRRCSSYYSVGIAAALLIWIIAAFAPGTLTVESVFADGELMAFAIGAVPQQSILNGTSAGLAMYPASLNSISAASVAWAEMELGVQYSFDVANTSGPDYAAYIAPVPLDLASTTSARWLSDVIGVNPTCSWAATNLTTIVQPPDNSTLDSFNIGAAYLPDFNLDVLMTTADLGVSGTPFATVKDPTIYVTNHTTHAPPSDGSTVFFLGQCQSGSECLPGSPVDLTLDLSGINNVFTISVTNQTWTAAILVCTPNITVETREVRNDGLGLLSVQPPPAGQQLTRQGNLDTIQTTAMFSVVTISLSQSTGQLSGTQAEYYSLGSQLQGDVLFGKAQFDNLPGLNATQGTLVTISPAPIENITQRYTQILRSASKAYLAGYLGTAYVPGRVSASEIVFSASLPNLAISTTIFVLLAVLIVVVHFRPGKGIEFTLVNVAAAVHGSELPTQFAQIKADYADAAYEDAEGGAPDLETGSRKSNVRRVEGSSFEDQQDIVEMLGGRRIFMQRRADGSFVLRIS